MLFPSFFTFPLPACAYYEMQAEDRDRRRDEEGCIGKRIERRRKDCRKESERERDRLIKRSYAGPLLENRYVSTYTYIRTYRERVSEGER